MVEMTPKALRNICRDLNLYTTPEINDKLYLHYKGWSKVQNLEPYTGLKVLYLEGNGFTQIEGLDTLTELRCLYLQENQITRINHISHLTELDTLNLNQNAITSISGLSTLNKLNTLLLQKNKLSDVQEMKGLLECPSIACLDLSSNRITDPSILDLLVQLPNLKVLYLRDNDVVQEIKNYRRVVISKLKSLTYLDDRPIDANERLAVEAWAVGGADAERVERDRQRRLEYERETRSFEAFERMIAEARAEKQERDEKSKHDTTPSRDIIQPRIQVIDDDEEPSQEEQEEKVHSDEDHEDADDEDEEVPTLEDVFITKRPVTETTVTSSPPPRAPIVTETAPIPIPSTPDVRPESPDDGYIKEEKKGHVDPVIATATEPSIPIIQEASTSTSTSTDASDDSQHEHEQETHDGPLADVNEINLAFHDEMAQAALSGVPLDDPLNDLD